MTTTCPNCGSRNTFGFTAPGRWSCGDCPTDFLKPQAMTALSLLHQAIQALDNEVTALEGYTDSELQEAIDLIEALAAHKPKIFREACKRT